MLLGTVFYWNAKYQTPFSVSLSLFKGIAAPEVSEYISHSRTQQWDFYTHYTTYYHCSKTSWRWSFLFSSWYQLWQGRKCYFHMNEIMNAVKQYLVVSRLAWKIICSKEELCQELLICQKCPALELLLFWSENMGINLISQGRISVSVVISLSKQIFIGLKDN